MATMEIVGLSNQQFASGINRYEEEKKNANTKSM